MRNALRLVYCLIFSSVLVRADVLSFRNGDRLTGEWLRITGGKITFKADTVGEVGIPVDKVKSFVSAKPSVILLRGGGTIFGKLALGSSGDWYITTDEENRVLPASAVEAIYARELYEPRKPERTARPWQNWHGTASLGYSLARGDLQASNTSIGLDTTRLHPNLPGLPERERTNFHLETLLANTRAFNGSRVSANSATSGLRQDFLFTVSNFVFVLAQLDHVQAQSLELRQTYGAGLGRDLRRSSRTTLSFLGGTTWVREDFEGGVRRVNAEGLVGEKLNLKLSEHLGLSEYFNFYPSLSAPGQYRVDATSTLSARVNNWLSMNTGFTDRYLSLPLPGHQGNELLLTTGLGFRF